MSTAGPPFSAGAAFSRGSPLVAFFLRETGQYVRGRGTLWRRMVFLTLAASLVLLAAYAQYYFGYWLGGRPVFATLMAVNGCYAFGLINSAFSQGIAEEREQGGLDLLRITGLSTLGLLVGKGTSHLVRALFSLLLQAPLCALCLTFGNIEPIEMLEAYLLLTALLFFACHAGIFSSVVCKTGRQASHQTLGIFFLIMALPWFVTLVYQLKPEWVSVWLLNAAEWLRGMNPFTAFTALLFGGSFSWLFLAFYFLGGLVFLGLAVARFEKHADRRPKTPVESAVRAARGNRPRAALPRIESRPFAWKEFHFAAGGYRGLKWRGFLYVLGCLFFGLRADYGGLNQMSQAAVTVGIMGLCSEISNMATRIFGAEVTNQTLADLVILPVSTRRLAWEKVLGFLPALLPPFVLIGIGVLSDLRILEQLSSGLAFVKWAEIPYSLVSLALVAALTLHFSLSQPKSAFGTALVIIVLANVLGLQLATLILPFSRAVLMPSFTIIAAWSVVYLLRIFPTHLQLAAAK